MEGLGLPHLLILLVILLVFFGPSRLPGLGQSIGKAIRGFKEGLNEDSAKNAGVSKQISDQSSDPIQKASETKKNQNQDS